LPGLLQALDGEAVEVIAAIKLRPVFEPLLVRRAQLAVRAAQGAELARARGDERLHRALQELVERRFPTIRWRLGRMSKFGDGSADFALGVFSAYGILDPRDHGKACEHFARALDNGFAEAKFRVSQCVREQEPPRAQALLREAADAGHSAANELLGRECLEARPADGDCALARLERAAGDGRPSAKSLVAWMLAEGIGRPSDLLRAVELYREAAAAGELSARNNLAELLESGHGVERDEQAALQGYRGAAEAGFAPAQFNLGRMYAEGRGVSPNINEARRWLEQARQAGISRAAPLLDRINLGGGLK